LLTNPASDPNEAQTRDFFINPFLRAAGWNPAGDNVPEYPIKNMPSGNGFADYVLWGDDGKPLAVVEAKRIQRNALSGAQQAKLYADGLEKTFHQRPFIFFTNGNEIWFWDDTRYPQRHVYGFYTQSELQTMMYRRKTQKKLLAQRLPDIANRPYQIEAIQSVLTTFEQHRRSALLVMATGTGKTRTAAALISVLTKANWAKRILFLADRNALITQAKGNLNEYLPQLSAIDLTKDKASENSRLVFSTYQTLIHLIDTELNAEKRHFGIGYFDLIIFDEIHRSVYNRYKHIFNYFDGLKIGLTATPQSDDDKDTYQLFGLEKQAPTYHYDLETAVAEGYLVPPRAMSVPLKFMREGIHYAELNAAEREKYETEFVDLDTGELPEVIEASDLNKWLFNEDTVDKVIAHVWKNGLKVEGEETLGKTIIFARNHAHAMYIQARFNHQHPHYKNHFLQVIDYQEERRDYLLNAFKDKKELPQIAVSVDMLDTGIDIPEVVNLVFFKPIRSRTKYWQMIGRGTRLCKDLFGQNLDKQCFRIFDFCENFEFFNHQPEGIAPSTVKSLSQRLFETRLKLAHRLRMEPDESLQAHRQTLLHELKTQTQALEKNSFIVQQHAKFVDPFRDAAIWDSLNELEIKQLLEHVAPLVVETEVDEMTKRFDALSYDLQILTYLNDAKQAPFAEKIKIIASKLVQKASIPKVMEQMPLLNAVQTDAYWSNVSVPVLEDLRKSFRELMRFLDPNKREIVYTQYEDHFSGIAAEQNIIYQPQKEAIYRGKPNLDTRVARLAFAELLELEWNPLQLQFIELVIDYFGQRGVLEIKRLFKPPFTDIYSGDMRQLFDAPIFERIKKTIERVNAAFQ
jgi:type I restriction enzyme, R subunit